MTDIARLHDMLAKAGITVTPAFTGNFIRNGSQYFRGMDLGGGLLWAVFGDWSKKGSQATWQSSGAGGEISADHKARIAAALAEQEAERKQHWEIVAKEAEKLWANAADRGSHPYLEKKQLKSLHGARIMINEAGHPVMLVPMRDVDGKLWNVTRIYSTEFVDEKTGEKRGNKFVLKGGRKEGLFHLVGHGIDGTPRLIFAEGFATAASIAEDMPESAIACCFDAGNLAAASEALTDRYPNIANRYWLGDDDCYKPEKGNAGREAASYCASEFGGKALFPLFKDTRTLPTDFNDLRCLEGPGAIRKRFEAPEEEEKQLPEREEDDEKKPHFEEILVRHMLHEFQANLIKQEKDVFQYDNVRWLHHSPRYAQDHFIQILNARTGGRLEFKKLKQTYERLLAFIPHAPVERNMFAPPPFTTNFRNGALDLLPQADGSFKLHFRAKRRDDLLCYSHPFDYVEDAKPNQDFEDTLKRVLSEEAIGTFKEVLGACLLPAFPKVVFFMGKPGSGKSTLILFAHHLVSPDLRCSVDPADFRGFGMETMAGKLVNLHSDIVLSRPIAENVLKLIEDRIPVRIQRKGITDLYAPLPAMHLFGANGLPETRESVAAFRRRVLIFRCAKYQAPETGYTRDHAHLTWDRGPGGIIAQAIQGLQRVATNLGHFTPFAGSREEMQKWEESTSDMVQQFVEEMANGEGQLLDSESRASLVDAGMLTRSHLLKAFYSHCERVAPRRIPPTAFELYSRLRELGFTEIKVRGVRGFKGFSVKETPGAAF